MRKRSISIEVNHFKTDSYYKDTSFFRQMVAPPQNGGLCIFLCTINKETTMDNTEKAEIINAQIMALENPTRFFNVIGKAKSLEEIGRAYNVSVTQAKAMGEIPIKWIGNRTVLNRLRIAQAQGLSI